MNRLRLFHFITVITSQGSPTPLAYESSHSYKDREPLSTSVVQRRSLDWKLPETEYVCPTTVMKRHIPHFGHNSKRANCEIPVENGSFVQIQQDQEQSFEATLVECTNGQHRPPCHGIDIIYSSECVTLFEWRRAYVRLPNLNVKFVPAKIKIPIACQCRITKKLKPFDSPSPS